MKTRILLFAALFALALVPPCTAAQPAEQAQSDSLFSGKSAFQEQLQGLTTLGMPVMDIAKYVMERAKEEPSKISYAVEWAEGKSMNLQSVADVNAFYFMLYSDLSMKYAQSFPGGDPKRAEIEKQAFQSLAVFETMLRADIARCKDQSVKTADLKLLPRRYDDLSGFLATQSPGDMDGYWDYALKLEDAADARPANPEACDNSVAVRMAGPHDKPQPEKITAAYIDAAAWPAARAQAREDVAARQKEFRGKAEKTWPAYKKKLDDAAAAAAAKAAQEEAHRKAREDAQRQLQETKRKLEEAQKAQAAAQAEKQKTLDAQQAAEQAKAREEERKKNAEFMKQQERFDQEQMRQHQEEGYGDAGGGDGGEYGGE